MAWSADEEYRTRVMSRRGVVLMVREPATVYGPAAMALLWAIGLMAALWAAGGFSRMDSQAAMALAVPTGAATVATALSVGARLARQQESSVLALVLRVGLVWAFFGAAWAVFTMIDFVGGQAGVSFRHLSGELEGLAMQAAAGAGVGLFAGIVGGAIATMLCVDRRA